MPLPLLIGGAVMGGAALVSLIRSKKGISVKNESGLPLLVVCSHLTPLHWGRVEPGATFNVDNKECNMGRVWFTVTVTPFHEGLVPTKAGVAAEIAGIVATSVAAAVAVAGIALLVAAAVGSGRSDGGGSGGGGHSHGGGSPIFINLGGANWGRSSSSSGKFGGGFAGGAAATGASGVRAARMDNVFADGKTLTVRIMDAPGQRLLYFASAEELTSLPPPAAPPLPVAPLPPAPPQLSPEMLALLKPSFGGGGGRDGEGAALTITLTSTEGPLGLSVGVVVESSPLLARATVVTRVALDGVAAAAGVQPGDQLVAVNSEDVTGPPLPPFEFVESRLRPAAARKSPEQPLVLVFRRLPALAPDEDPAVADAGASATVSAAASDSSASGAVEEEPVEPAGLIAGTVALSATTNDLTGLTGADVVADVGSAFGLDIAYVEGSLTPMIFVVQRAADARILVHETLGNRLQVGEQAWQLVAFEEGPEIVSGPS